MKESKVEKIQLAAGCFWGVQQILDQQPGVLKTTVGYSGGHTKNPNYKEICTGSTGHAETVLVEYDPSKISLEVLLNVFWRLHNPTTLNRQGPDIGHQYRSAIFYYSEEQKEVALKSKKAFDEKGDYSDPAVTEILPSEEFYPAEDYHQKYFEKNPGQGCHYLRPE